MLLNRFMGDHINKDVEKFTLALRFESHSGHYEEYSVLGWVYVAW
jgi:hypothetical protein